MMTIEQLTGNLKAYINTQIETMAGRTPAIRLVKPFITRALDKKFHGVDKMLELISDDNGNIDVEGILSELYENVENMEPYTFHNPSLGDMTVGGGQIKIDIPFIGKGLVLNMDDLNTFKEMIINKE